MKYFFKQKKNQYTMLSWTQIQYKIICNLKDKDNHLERIAHMV